MTTPVRRSAPTALPGNNLELSYGGPAFAGDTGAIANDSSRSTTFNGTSAYAYGQNRGNAPTVYSAEVWFKTNTTRGGKIFGFGNGQPNRHGTNPGLSGSYDRNLYMTNAGTLIFGVYVNGTRTVSSALPVQRQRLAPRGGDAGQRRHAALR